MNYLKSLLCTVLLACSVVVSAAPVNVNTASAEELASALKGVGENKAQAIIDYRQQHGPFKSVDELVLVKGIGEKTVQLNRDDIRLE